jgi:Flp pilus assembly pilin Flp
MDHDANDCVIPTQRGQTSAEYAIVLSMITFAVVTTISLLSGTVTGLFQSVLDAVTGAA